MDHALYLIHINSCIDQSHALLKKNKLLCHIIMAVMLVSSVHGTTLQYLFFITLNLDQMNKKLSEPNNNTRFQVYIYQIYIYLAAIKLKLHPHRNVCQLSQPLMWHTKDIVHCNQLLYSEILPIKTLFLTSDDEVARYQVMVGSSPALPFEDDETHSDDGVCIFSLYPQTYNPTHRPIHQLPAHDHV